MADKIEILDEFGEVLKAVRVREGQDGFEGVRWEGEFLFGAQLAGANLKGAQLQGVDLKGHHVSGQASTMPTSGVTT